MHFRRDERARLSWCEGCEAHVASAGLTSGHGKRPQSAGEPLSYSQVRMYYLLLS